MTIEFLDGRVVLHPGDCLEVLPSLLDASIDSIVCDPPYHLTNNMGTRSPYPGQYTPIGNPQAPKGGFMGKEWDGGDVAFRVELWAQALRVLKPGGHLVAFSGTRTYHRMACAIEDAGFEIRDQLAWCYGSGFPKSHDLSKAIDRAAGAERPVIGTRRGKIGENLNRLARPNGKDAPDAKGCGSYGPGAKQITTDIPETSSATEAAKQWEGWGTALKPAWEPIVLARKPLIGTVAENVLQHGTGAININGCRVETADDLNGGAYAEVGGRQVSQSLREGSGMNVAGKTTGREFAQPTGRWPANVVHDGSEEVLAAFPNSKSCDSPSGARCEGTILGGSRTQGAIYPGEDGSAARFFYTAKADSEDRLGSKHPTVKPLDLMQWLVRLVTPKGGTCLDPFAGTGTTGEAAWREGMRAILIEREAEYQEDIARRMDLATKPTKRAAVAKSKNKLDRPEDLPLFAK